MREKVDPYLYLDKRAFIQPRLVTGAFTPHIPIMSQTASRRPKVFRLDPAGSPHAQAGPQPVVEEAPDIYAQEARETADALRQPADDDELDELDSDDDTR